MEILFLIAILGGSFGRAQQSGVEVRRNTPVADALDWHSVWQRHRSHSPASQTCLGERRGSSYSFRCEPLSVAIAGSVDSRGKCLITSIRRSNDPEDGLRVPPAGHLVPPGVPFRKGAEPVDCGDLPLKEGRLEFNVLRHERTVDRGLSAAARDSAVAYLSKGVGEGCMLRFPLVKSGDPFFHVYEECRGVLEVVWEFTIQSGVVAAFPHWEYFEKRGLPEGTEWRRKETKLWFGEWIREEKAPPR